MPIYSYQCGACGGEFDLKQGFDASSEQPCPSCAGTARRRLALPAVIYKGSGFYTTDYARKGHNGASDSPSPPASPGTKSESKSSDATADAKSAAVGESG